MKTTATDSNVQGTADDQYQPVTLNGVTYLPMDKLVTSSTPRGFEDSARSLGCIPQRIKTISTDCAHAVATFLVPADKIEAFLTLTEGKGPKRFFGIPIGS
jgi:hypothetical protein